MSSKELNHNRLRRCAGSWRIVIIIFLSLISCDTVREISIEVLVPAEVTIPENIQSVAFVNRSYMPWLAHDPKDTLSRPTEDLYILDTIINNKFFLGLFDALSSSPLFDLADPVVIQLRRGDSARFPDPLSIDSLQSMTDTLNTDAIISLEGYRISDSLSAWSQPNDILYDPEYYFIEYKFVYIVEGKMQWRFYDGIYGTLIDEFIKADTTEWTVYGDSEEAVNELPEVVDAYREYAYQRGYDFGMRVSPSWSEVRRFYFITGNKYIRKAAEMAYNGKWEEAAALWKQESGSSNHEIAAKVAFNLALYSEKKDLIIPAIDWATKSYELIDEKYTKTYLEILEQRKLNKLKLQRQIPLK